LQHSRSDVLAWPHKALQYLREIYGLRKDYDTYGDKMKTTVLLLLSILQLVLRGKFHFVVEYNCSTNGIPAVAVVAGQGPDSPSVQFFLPLFDNCSVAELRKPAQLSAGALYLSRRSCNPDAMQVISLHTTLYHRQQAHLSQLMLLTRTALQAVNRHCSLDGSSHWSLSSA
jgi:hypothetical protein